MPIHILIYEDRQTIEQMYTVVSKQLYFRDPTNHAKTATISIEEQLLKLSAVHSLHLQLYTRTCPRTQLAMFSHSPFITCSKYNRQAKDLEAYVQK